MPRDLPLTTWMPPLIRTDFSDDAAWAGLVEYFATERTFAIGEFTVPVTPFDDRQYDGMTMEELLELAPDEDANFDPESGQVSGGPSVYAGDGSVPKLHTFAYIADAMTFAHPERPILAVSFYLDHGQHFRVAAASMVPVATNLDIANIDFGEYAESAAAEPDGILRDNSFD